MASSLCPIFQQSVPELILLPMKYLICLIVAKFRWFRILTLFLFKGIAEEEALKIGMDEKSQEFLQDGAAIYHEV